MNRLKKYEMVICLQNITIEIQSYHLLMPHIFKRFGIILNSGEIPLNCY